MPARPLYTQFAWAYDRIIAKPVEAWCQFIHAILQRHEFSTDARILDAGCGTGEYALRLGAIGYRVDGIDLSADMINQAKLKTRQRALDVRFSVQNMLESHTTHEYDVVLCRGVLNDLIAESVREAAFKSLAERLHKGGLLILDVRDWEQSAIAKSKHPVSSKRVATERGELLFESVTHLNPQNHELDIVESTTLTNESGIHTTRCNVIMRCWTVAELRGVLGKAGFRKSEFLGDYCESVGVGTTERIIAVARLGKSTAQSRAVNRA